MRTIIAPTDFSTLSLNAVNYAADLAVAIHADLLLLNVVQIPATVSEIPLTEFEYDEMTDEAERELYVLKSQLSLRTRNKINVELRMMVGSVNHELEEICEHKRPFAIVMATKGAGTVERFFIGSNTVFAVNNLKYPVLVVPQNISFSGIKKIALASDLEDLAEYTPIETVKEWVNVFRSSLDIINVSAEGRQKVETVPASISLLNQLRELHPQFYFLEKDNVEEGVYQFVEEQKPDLLIVIPKKHELVEGMFHRSRTKPFILHPHIPVLAISE